ncbi:hypothetical protein ACFSX5_15245 [Devosia albogilva]|uniref:Uncharacterized protein n=1 Tax=Devosia albogilva TaxID=429726 RepID=A0ABW5QNT4_9HYPH
MPGNTRHPRPVGNTLLPQLIYRAGFARDELEVMEGDFGGGSIRLPSGLDPMTFRVRDLGYMLEAYGLPYEIISDPKT